MLAQASLTAKISMKFSTLFIDATNVPGSVVCISREDDKVGRIGLADQENQAEVMMDRTGTDCGRARGQLQQGLKGQVKHKQPGEERERKQCTPLPRTLRSDLCCGDWLLGREKAGKTAKASW